VRGCRLQALIAHGKAGPNLFILDLVPVNSLAFVSQAVRQDCQRQVRSAAQLGADNAERQRKVTCPASNLVGGLRLCGDPLDAGDRSEQLDRDCTRQRLEF